MRSQLFCSVSTEQTSKIKDISSSNDSSGWASLQRYTLSGVHKGAGHSPCNDNARISYHECGHNQIDVYHWMRGVYAHSWQNATKILRCDMQISKPHGFPNAVIGLSPCQWIVRKQPTSSRVWQIMSSLSDSQSQCGQVPSIGPR